MRSFSDSPQHQHQQNASFTPGTPAGGGGGIEGGGMRRASSPTRRASISVKLSKTSSARPILYSKMHQEAILRLAEMIQEGDQVKYESCKGKLPVEAAYIVMKRVTEASGTPIYTAGLSTFNKLASLRTDPALTVLKKGTWRDFFYSTNPAQNKLQQQQSQQQRPSSATNRLPATPGGGGGGGGGMRTSKSAFALSNNPNHTNHNEPETTTQQQQQQQLEEMMELKAKSLQLINELAVLMIDRIQDLWQKLKIPQKEQLFYRKSLCQFPLQSFEQCKELAKLIQQLHLHETNIKHVLKMIRIRELAVEKFLDVISVVQRKFDNNNNNHNNNTTSSSSGGGSGGDGKLQEISKNQIFWKEEILLCLNEVRSSSIEVIKAIQEWRRSLWRPLPFLWKGVDYLLKMKYDLKILETNESFLKMIEMLPMKFVDLQGIFFLTNEQQLQFANNNTTNTSIYNNAAASAAAAAGTGDKERERSSKGGKSSSRKSRSNFQSYIDTLIQEFQSQFDFSELHSASVIVLEEEPLQKAIQAEEKALLSKGVFIPLLKPLTDRIPPPPKSPFHAPKTDLYSDTQNEYYVPKIAANNIPFFGQVQEEEATMKQGDEAPSDVVITQKEEFSSIRRPNSSRGGGVNNNENTDSSNNNN